MNVQWKLLLLALVAIPVAHADCPNISACADVKRRYNYQLEPLAVSATRIVEHEPISVSFRLTVKEFGLGVGPALAPVNLLVCPKHQHPEMGTTCKKYSGIKTGRHVNGQVTALAPSAGNAVSVSLVVWEQPQLQPGGGDDGWESKAEESLPIVSAARYEFALEEFEILHTRSTRTDTVWANLQALVKANPKHPSESEEACRQFGLRWCVVGVKYGDAQDGRHLLTGLRVGPYELVPGREESVKVLYSVYNYGESFMQKLGNAIADGFSKAGMIVLMGYGGFSGKSTASPAQELNKQMEALHGAMFAGCDGMSAVDYVIFRNVPVDGSDAKTLDGLTRATGEFHPDFTSEYAGGEYADGNTICGAGGKYRVRYSVYRTSWRNFE